MNASIHTSVLTPKPKQREVSPMINLAIWEVAYQKELKHFWKLITKKASRIKYLEGLDLFSVSEAEARKKTRHLKYLKDELDTLLGFKLFMDNLKDAYFETLAWSADQKATMESMYKDRVDELEKSIHILTIAFDSANQGEQFYTNLLVSILKELTEKNISLNVLKANHYE